MRVLLSREVKTTLSLRVVPLYVLFSLLQGMRFMSMSGICFSDSDTSLLVRKCCIKT